MMEDKKLDFNQPLLSVRRYAPPKVERKTEFNSRPMIPLLPPHRSELKSGPVSNPGTVPFVWEHSPGQPKEKTKPQPQKSKPQPPIAPKLPPGRYPNPNQQDSPKNEENLEATEERERSCDSGDSTSSSDGGAYVDALDTLSRAESSFLNCSTTGLDEIHVEPSRNFLQTREFMMDRFLPAAKAMAIETPQYALPKKQSLVEEGPKQIKQVVNHECKPSLRYGPSFAKRYSHYHENEEEEEESDDDYNRRGNLAGVCGLLPRFCLKSSLCLLNPVPAMSVRTRGRMVSSGNKGQPGSPSVGSYSETENESRSDRTEVKSIDKIHATELYEEKTKLRNEKEILAHPEEKTQAEIKTFQELLSDQDNPVMEKTLHVDTVKIVEPPNIMAFSPNTQDTKDGGIFTKEMDQMHAIDSSLEDFKKLINMSNAPKFDDFNILSAKIGENREFKVQLTENEGKELSQLPVPPPLPKSPSDSWLWRTLPSISTKNISLASYPSAATKGSIGPKSDIKWETMVKTTRVQRRHLHYSEETLTTIPET